MRGIILACLVALLFVPNPVRAQGVDFGYVDIRYIHGVFKAPERGSFIRRMLTSEEKKLFVVATVLQESVVDSDPRKVIAAAPQIIESFHLTDGEIERTSKSDICLQRFIRKTTGSQILLRVEFFSMDKAQETAFVSSINALAGTFASAALTVPQASTVVSAAMNAISSVLLPETSTYVLYEQRVTDTGAIGLHFNERAQIESITRPRVPNSARGLAANLFFDVQVSQDFAINTDVSFSQQPLSRRMQETYGTFRAAVSDQRLAACRALSGTLEDRFSKREAELLLAIAINDVGYLQDDSQESCMDAKRALELTNQYEALTLVGCRASNCIRTKDLTQLLYTSGNPTVLNSFLNQPNGPQIEDLRCAKNVGLEWDVGWRFLGGGSADGRLYNYASRICRNGEPYRHEFSWLQGQLIGHVCQPGGPVCKQ